MKQQKPRPGRRAFQAPNRVIFAAFFLSGLAGLMHEVVWAKLLVRLIGATAYAQAAVLAVFMGGAALGAVLFGRLADRTERRLKTYLVLEVLIGAYCLLLPFLLQVAGVGYLSLATHFFESVWLKTLLRFALVILLVLFPAVLMGGTLPIVARHLVSRVEETRRQVANPRIIDIVGVAISERVFSAPFTASL